MAGRIGINYLTLEWNTYIKDYPVKINKKKGSYESVKVNCKETLTENSKNEVSFQLHNDIPV